MSEPCLLSPAQRLLVGLDAALPRCGALNLSYALRVTGPIQLALLELALGALVRRHPALRTSYDGGGGRVCPAEEVSVVLGRGRGTLEEAAAAAARDAGEPFELAAPPLVRARAIEVGPEEHVLLLSFHHVAADGWALELFCRELSRGYEELLGGKPRQVAEPKTDAAARDLAQWRDSEGHARARAFWTRYLAGLAREAVTLPSLASSMTTGGMRASEANEANEASEQVPSTRGRRRVWPLPGALVAELAAGARARGASLYMMLLAAVSAVLGRATGAPEVVIGSQVSGRMKSSLIHVMGAFYDSILLRIDLRGEPTLGEVLLRCMEGALAALDRQGVTYPELAELAAAQPGGARGTVPAVMLFMDRHPLHRLRLAGAEVEPLHLARGDTPAPRDLVTITPADLTFFFREGPESLTLTLFFKPERVDAALVERLGRATIAALERLVSEPERPVSELDEPDADDDGSGGDAGAPAAGGWRLRASRTVIPVDAVSPVVVSGAPDHLAELGRSASRALAAAGGAR